MYKINPIVGPIVENLLLSWHSQLSRKHLHVSRLHSFQQNVFCTNYTVSPTPKTGAPPRHEAPISPLLVHAATAVVPPHAVHFVDALASDFFNKNLT